MEEIKNKLKAVIKETYSIDVEPNVTEAPKDFDADYSTNVAMQICKQAGKNPREVATEIVDAMKDSGYTIEIAGPGFLNFKSSDEYFKAKIADFGSKFTECISHNEYADQTVICEFSDPNPFKVLHVGRSRRAQKNKICVPCLGFKVIAKAVHNLIINGFLQFFFISVSLIFIFQIKMKTL